MFDRFTEQAREVMRLTIDEAGRLGQEHVDPAHLLIGLLREEEGVAARALSASGVTLEAARGRLEAILGRGEGNASSVTFTVRLKKVLDLALGAARRLGDDRVGTQHLLLALASEPGGAAAEILTNLSIDQKDLRAKVASLIGREDSTVLVSKGLGDEDRTGTLWTPGNDDLDLDRPVPPPTTNNL